jgi:hypothetical protein
MQSERATIGSRIWLQWVVASSLGWAVGGVVLSLNVGTMGDQLGNVVGDAALGLMVGISQWLVLRQYLDRAGWWIVASAGGFLLAASLGEYLLQPWLGENAGGLLLTIGLGLVPGILQWLFLRRQVARAGWWALASTVLVFISFLVGVATVSGTGLQEGTPGFGAVAGIVGGVVLGSTSGLLLVWLLRQPAPASVGARLAAE